jgi:hypothetical protein
MIRFLGLVLATTWALTGSAHSWTPETFETGYAKRWGEQHGPQFMLSFSEVDVATIRRAFDNLALMHERDPGVVDDYLMGRRARLIETFDSFDYIVLGPHWEVWRVMPMTQPEITLTGYAVSLDRYCRPEDQDVDDWHYLDAVTICRLHNEAAITLYERNFRNAQHVTPGGAQ